MTARHTLCSLLALLLMVGTACGQQRNGNSSSEAPRNVILFIADGAGPASYTMARDFVRWKTGRRALVLDSLLVGSVRTFSASARVTDSAAGATAYAAGVKTYNGAIAVDTLERPVATILEGAERKGMATGLVATSRITHATPAAFAAHVPDRGMENMIAAQMLTHDIEVLLGGGRRHFLPASEGGARTDGRNLIAEARAEGYTVVQDRAGLRQVETTPVLGLFAESHMAYEIDRETTDQPSLAAMTRKAIGLLEQKPGGFFLMVEGSRIDHAAHANDAAAHLHDVLAFEQAVAAALDFARRNGRTLVVVTSDHETGGLTLGRGGEYAWHPQALAEVEASQAVMAEQIIQTDKPERVLREKAGITDLTEGELAGLDSLAALQYPGNALGDILSRRARVGWTTHGHTAVDVNVYAYGPGRARFIGNHDNTYIGDTLADLLDVDLKALTERLRERMDVREAASTVEHR